MGTAQNDVSRKKQRGGGVGAESEGTPVVLFNKSSFRIPDSGIPYDWYILTAVVSTRGFITLIGNVMG